MFKLWSELNDEAYKELKPDLGSRSWDSLKGDEKRKMWQYLDRSFFILPSYGKKVIETHNEIAIPWPIVITIVKVSELYQASNFTPYYLAYRTHTAAGQDFLDIFINQGSNIVFELLSIFAQTLLRINEDGTLTQEKGENDEEYTHRLTEYRQQPFNNFAKSLNGLFDSFGINFHLTLEGFIPKHESKIAEEIYKPALQKLRNKKYLAVNRDIKDAFKAYMSKDFSGCITHVSSAMQAFLQITVNGKTGTGEISLLLKSALKQNKLPSDNLSQHFFKMCESVLARIRKEKGDPHPKEDYATEKDARLTLNLIMLFFEHSI